jgi:hypothetical protein
MRKTQMPHAQGRDVLRFSNSACDSKLAPNLPGQRKTRRRLCAPNRLLVSPSRVSPSPFSFQIFWCMNIFSCNADVCADTWCAQKPTRRKAKVPARRNRQTALCECALDGCARRSLHWASATWARLGEFLFRRLCEAGFEVRLS